MNRFLLLVTLAFLVACIQGADNDKKRRAADLKDTIKNFAEGLKKGTRNAPLKQQAARALETLGAHVKETAKRVAFPVPKGKEAINHLKTRAFQKDLGKLGRAKLTGQMKARALQKDIGTVGAKKALVRAAPAAKRENTIKGFESMKKLQTRAMETVLGKGKKRAAAAKKTQVPSIAKAISGLTGKLQKKRTPSQPGMEPVVNAFKNMGAKLSKKRETLQKTRAAGEPDTKPIVNAFKNMGAKLSKKRETLQKTRAAGEHDTKPIMNAFKNLGAKINKKREAQQSPVAPALSAFKDLTGKIHKRAIGTAPKVTK